MRNFAILNLKQSQNEDFTEYSKSAFLVLQGSFAYLRECKVPSMHAPRVHYEDLNDYLFGHS